MNKSPIDPAALSFDEIKANLVSYAKASAVRGEGWLDFLDSSAGNILIELLAGRSTYGSTHALAALRESFLLTARKYGNIVDAAAQLGYNCQRRAAPSILVNVTSRASQILGYRDIQGSCQGYPLALKESLTVGAGTAQLRFYLGEWKEFTTVVDEGKAFKRILIEDTSVDNRENDFVRLTINGDAIPLTAKAEEIIEGVLTSVKETVTLPGAISVSQDTLTVTQSYLLGAAIRITAFDNTTLMPYPLNDRSIYYVIPQIDPTRIRLAPSRLAATQAVPQYVDLTTQGSGKIFLTPLPFATSTAEKKVVVRTTSDGIQLLFGDGYLGYLAKSGDTISVKYLSTVGALPVRVILPKDVTFIPDMVPISIESIDRGSDPDSGEKISLLAPAYFGAKRRMVTEADHAAVLQSFSGDVVSGSAKKVETEGSCCTVQMCYLLRPYPNGQIRTATNLEKADMIAFLEDYRMIGVKLELLDPAIVYFQPKITVLVGEGEVVQRVIQEIQLALADFCFKLGSVFHVGAVVDTLVTIQGVHRVYMHRPVSDRVLEWNQYVALDRAYLLANLSVVTNPTKVELVVDTTGGFL